MKLICDSCEHQRKSKHSANLECGIAYYEDNAYGSHQRGATCVHDYQLSDRFKPRTESSIQELANGLEHKAIELIKARDLIARLKSKLTQ